LLGYNASVRRLDRYVLAEILGPLGLGFLVYTFILLLRFLFTSAELIIRRGLPWSTVGDLLLLTLPNIVVLTVPMSLLFGILIAVGRLASDSELIAIRASGIGLSRLYRPTLTLSAILMLINIALMVYALPWGNHGLQQLRLSIMTQSVSQEVKPRVFSEEWNGKVLYVFESLPDEKSWRGVFLSEAIPSTADNQITTAEVGEVRVDDRGERVVLVLKNAVRHKLDLDSPTRYEFSRQNELEMVLEDKFLTNQKAKVSASKGLRELTLSELSKIVRSPQTPAEQRNLARVEIHKKFSIPAACLAFGLIALPLGFNNRRGGKASGFALSIAVLALYYVLLFNGEEAARFGKAPAWLAMWAPNVILAVVGIFLLTRKNRDKSILISRVDRWVREEFWSAWRFVRRWRREKRQASADRKVERMRIREAREVAPTENRRVVLRIPRLRLLFPNLLDRYVIRLFCYVMAISLASGIGLYIVADLSQIFDEILKNKIGRAIVFDYYKYMSLQIFYDIAPIVILVATLMTFSLLARSNEVTASKALGISLYRLALPVVIVASLFAGLCGLLESEVLPASNEKVAQLKDVIRAEETVRTYRRADRQWLFGRGRYIYNYAYYDPKLQALQRLQVFDFDERHNLVRRLYAKWAKFDGQNWIFEDGWVRTFKDVDVTSFVRFTDSRTVAFPETPEYFNTEIRPPEQMSYGPLKAYIQEIKESGQEVPELEVQLHNKLAFPFISIVMALVALPFAFRLGRQGALYGIGLSIVLGIAFLAVFAFFRTLGETGALPPIASVWTPSLLFGMLSLYLFLGVRS
jgi:LPS export ABC transporter permease LptG/LPS export ABC transporter permease LptF